VGETTLGCKLALHDYVIPRACAFSSRPRDLAWGVVELDVMRTRSLTRLKNAEVRDDLAITCVSQVSYRNGAAAEEML
jgi:hypothetical protein